MLYFDRIDVSVGLLLIKYEHQKSIIFATIGISQIKALSFNQMYAIDPMIY